MSMNISEPNIFIFLHFPENYFLFKCSKGGSSFTEISLSAGNHRGGGLMGCLIKKGMRRKLIYRLNVKSL